MFLADPHQTAHSFAPSDAFLTRHSCLTAYVHGAILSRDPTANAYDLVHVRTSGHLDAPLPSTAAGFSPFTLDAFGYPPPFLLLPRAMLLVTANFSSLRILFGASSLALVLLGCAMAAKTLGGVAERRIWLLTPLFVANPVVLVTLQVGNFHLAVVGLCVLSWVALERRRDGLTGALLAAATLAKIFPGLLGVVLLAQRRWRAAAATIAVALALCALSVAVLGAHVWRDFLFYHLPHVQSGEALGFLAESPREIAFNLAPFGIPFKLRELGLAAWGWPEARRFANAYAVLLLVIAALAGRREERAPRRLAIWLALVMLASLRSPYAAPFVLSTMVVLMLALAAEVRSAATLGAYVGVIALFSVPTPSTNPSVLIALSLIRSLMIIAFLIWIAVRRSVPTSPPSP
jgi:hypothetical protein